uniref:Uncharacterized protein n=1 Tax=Ursus maritimus TaxID=29073 RepID=A0A452UCK1_URSMA
MDTPVLLLSLTQQKGVRVSSVPRMFWVSGFPWLLSESFKEVLPTCPLWVGTYMVEKFSACSQAVTSSGSGELRVRGHLISFLPTAPFIQASALGSRQISSLTAWFAYLVGTSPCLTSSTSPWATVSSCGFLASNSYRTCIFRAGLTDLGLEGTWLGSPG